MLLYKMLQLRKTYLIGLIMRVSVYGRALWGGWWGLWGGGVGRRGRKDGQADRQTNRPIAWCRSPSSLCLPFVMHPPHLQSCHWLVRTNHRMPCCLPAMYQFGQDDIKFLVLHVKDHMRTDVLITGSPRVLELPHTHVFISQGIDRKTFNPSL